MAILSETKVAGFWKNLVRRYAKFCSSIFGSVVCAITLLSVFLFLAFGIIFWSVNEKYMKNVIHQNGNNIATLVEGALYQSMLQNDRANLQNTLDVINTLTGIDEVNLYDKNNILSYSSTYPDTINHGNPNCISCHQNLDQMFHQSERSFRILEADNSCKMKIGESSNRHLLLKSPILNEKSCYQNTCHYHTADDVVLGSLIIRIPLQELDASLNTSSIDFFLLATLTTIILVVFLILFISRKIKPPLQAIMKASEAVASGDRSTRLVIKNNELADMRMVSEAFNAMLDSLQQAGNELQNWSQQLEYKVQKKSEELGEVQKELINIERIASLGKLSLSVAHEINNPLSGILIYTKLVHKQLVKQELDPEKKEAILKNLALIENETKRCGDIVKSLLDFSRNDQNDFEPKPLHGILQETFDLMSHSMKIANITFRADFAATADIVFCNPNQIKQACLAMLVNSSEAVTENPLIVIRTSNPDDQNIRFEIEDNGIGIAEEDLPHIFQPFFSTKQNSSGIGLGLAIVHGIIQSHNAKLDVKSSPGMGTKISITIPLIKSSLQ